jgi:hypothetical protein
MYFPFWSVTRGKVSSYLFTEIEIFVSAEVSIFIFFEEFTNGNIYIEFFFDFSDNGLLWGFSVFNMSSREGVIVSSLFYSMNEDEFLLVVFGDEEDSTGSGRHGVVMRVKKRKKAVYQ